MKIVIVGGVAGGATAASRLRRISEKYEIVLIERDSYISYANCGLPYYIGGTIKEREKLFVQTVEGLKSRFNIDVRVNNEVVSIDKDNKQVTVKNTITGDIYKESYDKLILSLGAKPIVPKIKGLDSADNIFWLRNIPDTFKIKDFVDKNKPKTAVVVGGGFIGVEMAENLAELGIDVTLVEKSDQTLRQFDFEMAQLVHQELNDNGVRVILYDGVSEFLDGGKKIKLDSQTEIESDITILSIGIAAESALAKNAGLKLGEKGHVIVDERYNTLLADGKVSNDIYAVGDMIEVINGLDDTLYSVPLAWGANRQGRLVADAIANLTTPKQKIFGSSVLKVFSLTAASVGANERTLKDKGIAYTSIHAHRGNHASYYPNSVNIALKLIFDKTSGKIYGAQAVGGQGTEKRIDVIGTVIQLGGTINDLAGLELCYAPPYSSAKDPVNILGYIAENVANDVYKVVYHYQIDKLAQTELVIDVRSKFEYQQGHIENAINLDIDEIRQNLDKLPKDKDTPIYLYCRVGLRGYLAINILRDAGYTNLYNLSGGYLTYRAYKYKPSVRKVKSKKSFMEANDMEQGNKEGDKIREIDASGLQCPGPLMAVYQEICKMEEGEKLKVTASDSGFSSDIENWCKTNGHTLDELIVAKGKFIATITKGEKKEVSLDSSQKNATIVVFSGELDKVIAAMIIAQGAAAQGKDVTMFFTFWGLNALRKEQKVKVKKPMMEKMFGKMMPKGAENLPLSNMNMLGLGQKMIKGIMAKKNVDSVTEMIKKAQESGVKMLACSMSMDLMGLTKEELIDNLEYVGVATYIAKNENVGTTLFI
ncbi:MAG: FAD-dependent oxidoreductase [Clostridiales bacterium]|nr:FAD-dependent oxidoreductase [Clostridiales bacterium]